MKSNEHKKRFEIDNFARHEYKKHARLNQLRADKKAAKRKERNFWKTLDILEMM